MCRRNLTSSRTVAGWGVAGGRDGDACCGAYTVAAHLFTNITITHLFTRIMIVHLFSRPSIH